MSFETTVIVGNADKECARLGKAAMLGVVGSALGVRELVFAASMGHNASGGCERERDHEEVAEVGEEPEEREDGEQVDIGTARGGRVAQGAARHGRPPRASRLIATRRDRGRDRGAAVRASDVSPSFPLAVRTLSHPVPLSHSLSALSLLLLLLLPVCLSCLSSAPGVRGLTGSLTLSAGRASTRPPPAPSCEIQFKSSPSPSPRLLALEETGRSTRTQ